MSEQGTQSECLIKTDKKSLGKKKADLMLLASELEKKYQQIMGQIALINELLDNENESIGKG